MPGAPHLSAPSFDPTKPGYSDAIKKTTLHEVGHSLGLKHYLPTFDAPCITSDNPKQYNLSSVMNSKCGINDDDGTPFSPNVSSTITNCDITQLLSANSCPAPVTPTPIPYYPPPEGCYNPIDNFSGNACPMNFSSDPNGGYCCQNQTPTFPHPFDCGGTAGMGICTNIEEYCECKQWKGRWNSTVCLCGYYTPILIDVNGDGFDLTSAEEGIEFNFDDDGVPEQIAWTRANSDDAWLTLDRNGNNFVDNGSELFGNITPQPDSPAGEESNGFLALAVYDKLEGGGDNDGSITPQDSIFPNLRLWRDANQNGMSEANELKTLDQLGLAKIELDYKESKRTDEHGNRFKYRAKVKDRRGVQIGRWAWDVILTVRQP